MLHSGKTTTISTHRFYFLAVFAALGATTRSDVLTTWMMSSTDELRTITKYKWEHALRYLLLWAIFAFIDVGLVLMGFGRLPMFVCTFAAVSAVWLIDLMFGGLKD